MRKLLGATDLLPKSEFAVDRAGLLAEELGAALSLLHVVAPESPGCVLEQSLATAGARMKSLMRPPRWRTATAPELVLRAGNPARVILETITSEAPDLLILGPHGKRGVVDALEGTIAEKAVSSRVCPVLVVQEDPRMAYGNVLLALDTGAASRFALRAAGNLVLSRGTRATVIHACGSDQGVLRPAGVSAHAHSSPVAATAAMRELLQQESFNPARYELVVAEGNPVRTIIRAMQARKPDLLVMGTRGEGRMRRAVLGSVANQLLKVARCDVLIVPRDASAATMAPGASRTARPTAPMSA